MEPFLVYKFYSREKPSDTWKKLPLLKRILALPTKGQECLVSELFQFLSRTFDLGHAVVLLLDFIMITWLRDEKCTSNAPKK